MGFLGAHVGSLCRAEEERSSWGETGTPLRQCPVGSGSARRKSTNSGQRKGFCFQCVSQLLVAAAKILLALQKETLFRGLYFQFQFNSSQCWKACPALHHPAAVSQPLVELPSCNRIGMASGSLGSLIYYTTFCA